MGDTQHASWQVTAQSPRTEVNGAGNLVNGYTVLFTTGDGHTGSVFVPVAQYNPDTVKGMIQPLADQLDAVGSLTSDS